MPMFQPVGGMDRLPHALADAIDGKLHYGAEVRSITTTGDGVKVGYRDSSGKSHEAEADYCVCSIPPTVLRSIPSNFAADVRDALRSLQAVPVGKLGLEYGRRFWEEDEGIFGGVTDTNMDIATIWYPSSGYLGKSGVLIGYYNFFDQADLYGVAAAGRAAAARARGRAEDPRRRVREALPLVVLGRVVADAPLARRLGALAVVREPRRLAAPADAGAGEPRGSAATT